MTVRVANECLRPCGTLRGAFSQRRSVWQYGIYVDLTDGREVGNHPTPYSGTLQAGPHSRCSEDRICLGNSVGCGKGEMNDDQILSFIKNRKPYIHATLENTTPETAVFSKDHILNIYSSIGVES